MKVSSSARPARRAKACCSNAWTIVASRVCSLWSGILSTGTLWIGTARHVPAPGMRIFDSHGMGGRFEGPRVKASVQTPAGDWITNRADGSYRLDVRLTLKTDDGALILVTYNGIGQTTDAGASLRIAPLFETGESRYVWLTRLQAVGGGQGVGTAAVTYDIYALK